MITWVRGRFEEAVETTPTTFRRALTYIDRTGLAPILERDLTAKTGRPRLMPFRALLTVLMIKAMADGEVVMTGAAQILRGLNPSQRHDLGITGLDLEYANIESGIADITAGLAPRVNIHTGEVLSDPRLRIDTQRILDLLVNGSVPDCLTPTTEYAIDATDYETSARRRSRSTLVGDPYDPTEEAPQRASDWPRTGPDGRHVHTPDPDARDGFRSGKNLNSKEIYCGYAIHLAADVVAIGQPGRAPIVRAATVTPAGSSSPAAGLALVDSLTRTHGSAAVTHVLADRAYSNALTEKWAQPLTERGISQSMDLHSQQQTTRPGPIPGTLTIDGGVFLNSIPDPLRDLKRPGLNATEEMRARSAEQFDRREPYAFDPYGPVRTDGRRRFRGPALTGRVRCPNNARSMRLPHTKPMTHCVPGEPCACSKTFTAAADTVRFRQPRRYGTTSWLADYSRRNAVESSNSNLKVHHGSLRRGITRVFGLAKNSLFLGMIIAASNMRLIMARAGIDPMDPPTDGRPVALFPRPTNKISLHRRMQASRGDPPGAVTTPSPSND